MTFDPSPAGQFFPQCDRIDWVRTREALPKAEDCDQLLPFSLPESSSLAISASAAPFGGFLNRRNANSVRFLFLSDGDW